MTVVLGRQICEIEGNVHKFGCASVVTKVKNKTREDRDGGPQPKTVIRVEKEGSVTSRQDYWEVLICSRAPSGVRLWLSVTSIHIFA